MKIIEYMGPILGLVCIALIIWLIVIVANTPTDGTIIKLQETTTNHLHNVVTIEKDGWTGRYQVSNAEFMSLKVGQHWSKYDGR